MTASFAAKRAAKCWAGLAFERQYCCSDGVKQRLRKVCFRRGGSLKRDMVTMSTPVKNILII